MEDTLDVNGCNRIVQIVAVSNRYDRLFNE